MSKHFDLVLVEVGYVTHKPATKISESYNLVLVDSFGCCLSLYLDIKLLFSCTYSIFEPFDLYLCLNL